MERSEDREQPAHPDAKYQGKVVVHTREVQGGSPLKITIKVDSRDPTEWGTNSTTLLVEPIIHQTSFRSLQDLARFAKSIRGPLADCIETALHEIDHQIRPY